MANHSSLKLPDGQCLGDTGQTLGFALTRAWMHFHQAYSEALEPVQLTPSRMLALAFVVHNPGSDQSTLGAALAINKASAMAVVDRLAELRYIKRESGADRRSNALVPTPLGTTVYEKALLLEGQVETDLLTALGPRDVAALKRRLLALPPP